MKKNIYGVLEIVFSILGMAGQLCADVIAAVNGYWWVVIITGVCIFVTAYFTYKKQNVEEDESQKTMIEKINEEDED